MKILKNVFFALLLIVMFVSTLKSFSPMGRDFGLGLMIGEPTGLTAKIWTHQSTAFALSIGNSYMGNLRIGADYLWHFNAFNSNVINMYVGPGIAIGIGESGGWWYKNDNKYWYKQNDEIGVGLRGLLGFNIVPRNTPLEFFGELGLMFGFVPASQSKLEGAVGFRYYF